MPVEIRELIIRAVATRSAEDSAEQDQPEEGLRRSEHPADETQAIIQECVRQVLRILQQNKER